MDMTSSVPSKNYHSQKEENSSDCKMKFSMSPQARHSKWCRHIPWGL